MDAKTKNKAVHTLMTNYIKLYTNKYGNAPRFNRSAARWDFGLMLDDLGSEAFTTLEYYFTLKKDHSHTDLLRHYEDYNAWMLEDIEDEERRKKLREATKKKVEEFNQQWQQPST